jgi:glutaredoxin 3
MSVIVYSTPSCSYCMLVKNFLKARQVHFTEYDVSRDQRRADEMVRKSHQMGVPVVDMNGKIIVGFNQKEIEKALER